MANAADATELDRVGLLQLRDFAELSWRQAKGGKSAAQFFSVRGLMQHGSWIFLVATRRGMEAANVTSLEVTIEDRRDTLITLVAEVASDYINLRLEQRLLEIARSSL